MPRYTDHTISYRGRLIEVCAYFETIQSMRVLEGEPLDLSNKDSVDYIVIESKFKESKEIQEKIDKATDEHARSKLGSPPFWFEDGFVDDY